MCQKMRLHCSNRLAPNYSVFSTGTRSMASASAAIYLFGVRVNKITSATSALAILAKLTLTGVSPDPETITSPSHLRIDGAMTSPTEWTLRPTCVEFASLPFERPALTPLTQKNQQRVSSSNAWAIRKNGLASMR